MYDSGLDSNNPMFDLNRQLINGGENVIEINRDNLVESIKRILSNKPTVKNNCFYQPDLFD